MKYFKLKLIHCHCKRNHNYAVRLPTITTIRTAVDYTAATAILPLASDGSSTECTFGAVESQAAVVVIDKVREKVNLTLFLQAAYLLQCD